MANQFSSEKLKASLERWANALTSYCNTAEKEYNRIKSIIEIHKANFTDSDVKNITRLLGRIIFLIKFKCY